MYSGGIIFETLRVPINKVLDKRKIVLSSLRVTYLDLSVTIYFTDDAYCIRVITIPITHRDLARIHPSTTGAMNGLGHSSEERRMQ